MIRFAPGRVIVHRHFQRDRLGLLKTVRVVSDDERGLLLWLERDSPMRHRTTPDGRTVRCVPFADWGREPTVLAPASWSGPGILKLLPPAAAHSVWWFWRDGRFHGWYVNLEEAGVRWDDAPVAGVDIVDQDLDIVVRPDRSWRWKDVEEFTERLAYPDYWVTDAAAVWAEGERVVKVVEAGDFPFDGTWTDFRPDPAWSVPDLPAGWDRPRAR